MAAAAVLDFYVMWQEKMSITADWINISGIYLHQILPDDTLEISLYNSLYYRTSRDHSLNGSKLQ